MTRNFCLLMFISIVHLHAVASTKVVYFGGWRSTEPQVKEWVQQVANQRPDLNLVGVPLKTPGWEDAKVRVEGNNPKHQGKDFTIDKIVGDLLNEKGPIVLAGHSSGAIMVSEVAKRLVQKSPEIKSRITIVDLDGNATKPGIDGIKTRCWTAKSPKEEKPPITGLYPDNMTKNCGPPCSASLTAKDNPEKCYRTFESPQCKPNSSVQCLPKGPCKSMCLHFRLINSNAALDLNNNTIGNGYQNLRANFSWLDEVALASDSKGAASNVKN
ncbi:MAG: hypothetical protein AB7O96_08690 [Pseudobdellovibrionaceae bacterium]